jgi:hypothetical protein
MKLFRLSLVVFCLFLLSLPGFAQDTETAEWGNFGLAVDYPSDWEVDDSGDDATLVLFSDDLAVYFWEPSEGDDAEQALIDIAEDPENEDYEFGDVDNNIEIMGDDAFRLDFESETVSGFIVGFEYDGLVFTLNAVVGDDRLSNSDEETLLEIVTTLHEGEGGGGGDEPSGDIIESALDNDSTGEDIVDELIELGLVADGGDLLFEEDEVIDATDLPESYEGGNIALGALISWEAVEDDEEYRYCALAAQTSTDDFANEEGTSLVVALGSDNIGFIAEFDLEDSDNSLFADFEADIDVEDQNHLLMIVSGDELSVYVNGELVVEGFELDLTAGDDELFAGFFSDLGCDMQSVWAYTFE